MSDRDELIAKARELSAAATPGPWNWANWGDVGDPDDVLEANRPAKDDADRRVWGETVSIKIAKDEDHDLSEADRSFLAESRTLLPALADLAESEGRRADEAEARCRTNEEILGDNMEMLARVRRILTPTAEEAPFTTDAVAVTRAGLLHALQQEQSECLGFLAGLGYEGTLVRAVVALADRATELKHERNEALTELAALKGQVESMRPVVEAVREIQRECAAGAADSVASLEADLEIMSLPPKEQP